MKKRIFCAMLCLSPNLLFAGHMCARPYVPYTGYFVGLGGSYNTVAVDQFLGLVGVSDVFSGTTIVASGTARGPANPFHSTQNTFAPEAQIGFYTHFPTCNWCWGNWLWGAKFSYSYINITATNPYIVAPQGGSFTTTGALAGTEFRGRATIGSAQTTVTNEFLLFPFIGISYDRGYAYLGVGPALFKSSSKFYNVVGYANINGVPFDVSGNPAHFASSTWIWGAASQVGATFYIDPTWSLDFNYTYAWTGDNTTNYRGRFTSTTPTSFTTALITDGLLLGDNTQRLTVQSFGITINKVFC